MIKILLGITILFLGIVLGIGIHTGIMDMKNINQERIDLLNQDILNQINTTQECENQIIFLREVIDRRSAYAAEVTYDFAEYYCAIEYPTNQNCIMNNFLEAMKDLDSYALVDDIYNY